MELTTFSRFGDFIKALREAQELSQRAMAKVLEVSPGYVGQWEAGVSKPSEAVVRRICLKFRVADEAALQRLAFAETAPEHIKAALLPTCQKESARQPLLSEAEALLIERLHLLPPDLRCAVTRKLNSILKSQLEQLAGSNRL